MTQDLKDIANETINDMAHLVSRLQQRSIEQDSAPKTVTLDGDSYLMALHILSTTRDATLARLYLENGLLEVAS